MDIGPASRFGLAGVSLPKPAVPADPAPAPSTVSSPPAPGTAPAGQDATLWDILTEEERAFFLTRTSLGPLTYGPAATPHSNPAAPVGQRVDVRV